MLVIGLTGGIGSGKSTVAALFAEHHVPIVDADVIAKALTQPGKKAYESIVGHFGSGILKEDKTINRQQLREIIFSKKREKKWLERLLHPLIYADMRETIAALDAAYCIAVVPLLLESDLRLRLDRILVVDNNVKTQIKRAKERDGCMEEMIQVMIESQAMQQKRLDVADDVINNEGDLARLKPQVDFLHQAYQKLAQA